MTLATVIKQWQMGRIQAREFEALGTEERKALARDIGIPDGILADLINRGPQSGVELPRLMTALSIDVEEARRRHSGLMRDMSVVCSECREASRCRRDLASGQARESFADYCPNAETLQELQEFSRG